MIARLCRVLLGAALISGVAVTAAAQDIPRVCSAAAIAIAIVSMWRPGIGLVLTTALAPAGLLLAPAPARAAELIAWAFLAGWLLGVWRPLTSGRWPRAATIPAAIYMATCLASWLGMTIAAAGGIAPAGLPLFLFHALTPDYLRLSSPEPETWTLLQALGGTALFLGATVLARDEPRVARGIAWALALSMAALSVATLVSMVMQWSANQFDAHYIRLYIETARVSLHLSDLNAAGSQYVLAGLAALGLATFGTRGRGICIVLLAVMVPAMWLTGSRSAGVGAIVIGAITMLAAAPGGSWKPTRAQMVALTTMALLILVAGGIVLARDANVKGSAGRAMRLRTQFSQTSVRMFATAPIFGVGIGRYHGRSGEFMPEELRSIYGFENAHNYVAQQFAELGVIGGAIFIWLMAAAVSLGWRGVRRPESRHLKGVIAGLFAGVIAYLMTCLTGHPLLVSEAAFPFWIALGAMTGSSLIAGDGPAIRRGPVRLLAMVIVAALVLNVGRGTVAYAHTASPPGPQGLGPGEVADDGTRFYWTSPHVVTYVDTSLGFLVLTMRAPDDAQHLPFIVETQVDGRRVDRRELTPGMWVTSQIPVRRRTSAPFRRIDIRVNQLTTRQRLVGRRMVDDVLGMMVQEIRWIPLTQPH